MPKTATRERYDVHPSVKMVETWIETLPEKTGKSLDEWLAHLEKRGPKDVAARRDWLKKEHGLGTNTCFWLARYSVGEGWEDGDPKSYLKVAPKYVADMYAGPRAGLKPIHDRLVALARSLGDDVKVCPCKTIVPLYRNHVFAEIKPSTRTRIDFGFALRDQKATGRLIDTGGFAKKDRITHRIPIASVDEIDAEVEKWLKKAYAMDA
jgi:hypothetical protein